MQAESHLSEALMRCRAINNVEHEADILLDLARLHYIRENYDEAKTLAINERNKLKKAAAEEETKILAEAHEKATAQLQEIKKQVANEAEKAGEKLKGEAENLAGQIATKILGRELA